MIKLLTVEDDNKIKDLRTILYNMSAQNIFLIIVSDFLFPLLYIIIS